MMIIGQNPHFRKVLKTAELAARSDAPVLIYGETGTGKELVAQKIHSESRFQKNPFIAIDCGALSDNLLESELFGHEIGAFTGAIKKKIGIFERANRSTVFLDEIGNASKHVQYKLLRVLQEKQFLRLGGETPICSDFRLIAATNEDLKEKVQQGYFRSDLYFRLSVIPIHLPPLRERKQDIPLLVEHFLDKFTGTKQELTSAFKNKIIENSLNYNWYGNVRELENYIQRALAINNPDCIIDNSDLFITNTSEQYQFTHNIQTNARILESYINDIIDKIAFPDDKLRRSNLQNIFKCSKDILIRTVKASQGRLDYVVRKNDNLVKQKSSNSFIYPTSHLNHVAIVS